MEYRALICCRAGMGSSVMLKIKAEQVINENNFPIKCEHGNLDSLKFFDGDLVITMSDLTEELARDYADKKWTAVGVTNIVDKNEMKEKLEGWLAQQNA